ncbi:MAG: N-acetyl-gamma-glutamyl-phosphate reductase [Polyangiaceae bacterium]
MQSKNPRKTVGVIGASGYAGIEATKILARHPEFSVALLTSDRWAGKTAEQATAISGSTGRLRYVGTDRAVELARVLDAVILGTPAEASLALAPTLVDLGVHVVDMSGAFRLADVTAYPKFYGFEHTALTHLSAAIYGIPEVFRDSLRGAKLIASGGCYATAAALALTPLARAGLIGDGAVVVDALSGTTGAGRSAKEEMSFSEIDGNARAYRVLEHQHTPEIAQTVERAGKKLSQLLFTPHLVPMRRGILATAYVPLRAGVSAESVHSAYVHNYASSPFVRLLDSANDVQVAAVSGTYRCDLGFAVDAECSVVVVVAALDNLLKGAASQAVQNLNLALGFEETAGLVDRGAQ